MGTSHCFLTVYRQKTRLSFKIIASCSSRIQHAVNPSLWTVTGRRFSVESVWALYLKWSSTIYPPPLAVVKNFWSWRSQMKVTHGSLDVCTLETECLILCHGCLTLTHGGGDAASGHGSVSAAPPLSSFTVLQRSAGPGTAHYICCTEIWLKTPHVIIQSVCFD